MQGGEMNEPCLHVLLGIISETSPGFKASALVKSPMLLAVPVLWLLLVVFAIVLTPICWLLRAFFR